MKSLCLLAATSLFAQPAIHPQRAAAMRQREAARRQAESAGATLLPSVDPDVTETPAAAVAPPPCDALPSPDATQLIDAAARTNDLNPEIIRAVITRESAFRPCAVSVKGAQGLMQLMPATAAHFNVSDPFDPRQNIEAGAKYLKQLIEKYKGDVRLALAAYNAGPATVDAAGGIPAIAETQDYVKAITARLSPAILSPGDKHEPQDPDRHR